MHLFQQLIPSNICATQNVVSPRLTAHQCRYHSVDDIIDKNIVSDSIGRGQDLKLLPQDSLQDLRNRVGATDISGPKNSGRVHNHPIYFASFDSRFEKIFRLQLRTFVVSLCVYVSDAVFIQNIG